MRYERFKFIETPSSNWQIMAKIISPARDFANRI